KSGCSSYEGILIRIEYVINKSDEKNKLRKKYKGGRWIDHKIYPCFTNEVRTDDIKAMENYTVKKPSYIYNIINKDDDLCFMRYIIVLSFLIKVEKILYLTYEDKEETFKNYY